LNLGFLHIHVRSLRGIGAGTGAVIWLYFYRIRTFNENPRWNQRWVPWFDLSVSLSSIGWGLCDRWLGGWGLCDRWLGGWGLCDRWLGGWGLGGWWLCDRWLSIWDHRVANGVVMVSNVMLVEMFVPGCMCAQCRLAYTLRHHRTPHGQSSQQYQQ
jgi:hypothetical protein